MTFKGFDRGYLTLLMVILVYPFILYSGDFGKVSAAEEVDSLGNQACLECHRDEKLYGIAIDGKLLSLWVDEEEWSGDVHSKKGIRCVHCHLEAKSKVHPKQGFKKVNCAMHCHIKGFRNHTKEYEQCQKSAHAVEIKSEEGEIIYCSDCHGKHSIRPGTDPHSSIHRDRLATTCTRCHQEVVRAEGVFNQIISYRISHHEKVNLCERNDEGQCLNCHYSVANHSSEIREKPSCEKCHTTDQYQQSLWFSPIHLKMSYKKQPTIYLVKLIYILFMVSVVVCVISYSVFILIKILRSREKLQEWIDKFPWLFEKGEG